MLLIGRNAPLPVHWPGLFVLAGIDRRSYGIPCPAPAD